MKHIGWCLEKIQIAMVRIPRSVDSQEDKKKATRILNTVQGYANTLVQLISNPPFKKSLSQLEKSPIEGIKLQAKEVDSLFKDLQHMLYVLDLYLKSLREIIELHPEQWGKKADQLVLMIDQKFGGERGELRKEFEQAVYRKDELKKLITSEKHLAAFLEL